MDLRIEIEIEIGSEPIRGVLRAANAVHSRHFVGWLDLVESIAAAAADAVPGTRAPDPAE